MPIITVFGLPDTLRDIDLQDLRGILRETTEDVKELNLSAEQVTVFFPCDRMASFGAEVIVFVEGLFPKPERTDEVKNRLAANIGTLLKKRLPKKRTIEVFVKTFDPAKGFWTSEQGG